MPQSSDCFHCGLEIPPDLNISTHIDGEDRAMCCHGCQAVAQAIVDAGMSDFYQQRSETNRRAAAAVPDFLKQLEAYDHPDIQKQFVHQIEAHQQQATLILEGIVCAACVWLNERHIRKLKGVLSVQINYTTHRAQVIWDDRKIKLSHILAAISDIGYLAHPYDASKYQEVLEQQRKQQIRRLGIAGALGMQIMVLAVALYTGDWWGIDPEFKNLFRWLSMVLCLPILLFAAAPLFKNAWNDIKHKQLGMDVPITLGIGIAFFGSLYATYYEIGDVYYDSVSMFVFFILAVRYFEQAARKKMSEASEALIQAKPAMANRFNGAETELIPVVDLIPDDVILVRPGETIAADGLVVEGQSSTSEALLTGESTPIAKKIGDKVIAGSLNIDSPLRVRVEQIGEATVLAAILRLLEKAQTEKPKLAELADRIAAWFVGAILFLALLVAIYHYWIGNPEGLSIVIAVLVVTCPCALSLATPAAISAASSHLSKLGLLISGKAVLETLAQSTHSVFDKTGTLTTGRLQHCQTWLLGSLDQAEAELIAASLEQGSEHPIAQALGKSTSPLLLCSELKNQAGAGVCAKIAGKTWRIGHLSFIAEYKPENYAQAQQFEQQHPDESLVWLADKQQIQAGFLLSDQVRKGALELVKQLKAQGQTVVILSGDRLSVVEALGKKLGVDQYYAELNPAQKLAKVRDYQAQGAIVTSIGDGINDAPLLAASDVSVAMSSGTQLAAAGADMLLLGDDLAKLAQAQALSKQTLRVIRQNLTWALLYNGLAVPLAILGYVPPWLAAIGMSFSSLFVVMNALRLRA